MSIVATLDYLSWIVQAIIILVLAVALLTKMKAEGFEGFMIKLTWLIIFE